jgi:hypothetical protein
LISKMVLRITQGIKLGWSHTVVKEQSFQAHQLYYDTFLLSTAILEKLVGPRTLAH